MKQSEKADIISSWNEIEEVVQNLDYMKKGCSVKERNDMVLASKDRLKRAMDLLGEYFTDEEAIDLV